MRHRSPLQLGVQARRSPTTLSLTAERAGIDRQAAGRLASQAAKSATIRWRSSMGMSGIGGSTRRHSLSSSMSATMALADGMNGRRDNTVSPRSKYGTKAQRSNAVG